MVAGFGLSFVVPLFAAGLLLPTGSFSLMTYAGVLVALLLPAAVAVARRPPTIRHARAVPLGATLAVAAAVATFTAVRSDFCYADTALLYLTYGSFVLAPYTDYPMMWAFGNEYVFPFMQQKYALVFPTMLLSSGDPFTFLRHGIPIVGVCSTTALAAGSFQFFRGFARPATAAFLASFFLFAMLQKKLFSIRAETLGWIVGFSFLVVFTACLRPRQPRPAVPAVLWGTAAAIFVTTALLHGIVTLVVASLALGVWVHAFAGARSQERRRIVLGSAGAALFGLVLLGALYYTLHYMHTTESMRAFIEIEGRALEAGETDPGHEFNTLYSGGSGGGQVSTIRAHPPAVSLGENLQVVLLRPIQQFIPKAGPSVNLALVAAGLVAWLALLGRRSRRFTAFPLAVGFTIAILALVGYSVLLNYRSVAWFPWAVVPRRFADNVGALCGMLSFLGIGSLGLPRSVRRPLRCVARAGLAVAALGFLLFAGPAVKGTARAKSPFLSENFLEAMRFIRGNAQPGDAAVANFGSMGHMAYLAGVPFTSEGMMPYEVIRLIRLNADALRETRRFLKSPDHGYADRHRIRFVLLALRDPVPGYWRFQDAARPQEFADGRIVLENRNFVVIEYSPLSPGTARSTSGFSSHPDTSAVIRHAW